MCTINELDVDVLPSAFISALELSNINNQGTITSLRVFLAKHTELPDLGGLIRTVGHNLVELSLDIRWAWTRCKTSTTLGGTSSGGDSLDIYKVPATLVSKALRKGFTALTNLRRLHLTLLNRDFVYRGFDDFGKSETVDEFEARAKIQAVHLIASIVELLPTPPPPSHDSTADAQRPGLLTHFSARITLSTWSTVPRSTFIPTPSSFDRIVLQPAWDRLQSALDIRCDDYTSVYVSLAGGSGATMIMKGGGFDCRWRKGENVLVSSDDGHSQSEH
ncbi:hypothetical protein BDY19DRAFT_1051950 [Irpex rosettiformis]|uniref:Uncharacterized protein n=1 Tax=Irpex rosettiformis TaxID=378272 RepID=A0ACB8TME6_9APHY|nr:hypothetical protein BDY19DRAFT_1051950 [Irpex rosettiformis]